MITSFHEHISEQALDSHHHRHHSRYRCCLKHCFGHDSLDQMPKAVKGALLQVSLLANARVAQRTTETYAV